MVDQDTLRERLRNFEKWSPNLINTLLPVMSLLVDPAITEIEINGFDDIWAKGANWSGHRKMDGLQFEDHSALRSACIALTEVTGKVINENSPMYDGRLPGGERVNVVVDPVCDRVAMVIRKFPHEVMTMELLLEKGSVSPEIAEMITGVIKAGRTTIASGPTNSGKTTMLNIMGQAIPKNHRVFTDEENRELQIPVPNQINLETREAYMEGQQNVTMAKLVKTNLRQTIEWIVIGEVRGDEAFWGLRGFMTGHRGLGTIHAESGDDALHQWQLLAMTSPDANLNPSTVAAMVAKAIKVVVHVEQFEEDSTRKVTEIIEVDTPGIRYMPHGVVEFRTRKLVEWVTDDIIQDGFDDRGEPKLKVIGHWIFPNRPSEKLRKTIRFKRIPWPKGSLEAPDPIHEEEIR